MNSPLNLNPAETGNFNGDYRFTGNHKRQWKSFANAYSTFSASLDKKFIESALIRPSAGILINNDIAGDANFGSLNIQLPLSLSYNSDSLLISIGVSPAFVQHNLEFSELNFGNQYDGDSFDPELPSDEYIDYNRFSYFDLNTGVNFDYKLTDSLSFSGGASALHINKPVKSFYSASDLVLPVRWQAYLSADYRVNNKFSVLPAALFMKQGAYREMNLGGQLKYDINPLGLRSLYAGILFRAKDAGILLFGMDYNKVRFTISYDINISGLRTISRGRGGVELSLIYVFKKTIIYEKPPVRKCPEFI